ncbi:SIP domain-containing protein [Psychrobacter sp. I-STPA10]|uniref:SIP domain-containing protein n=1 Tax=Psychrobacter sp. I-STPA10 TaxID=2585769 RepID=UPI001E3E50B3|nr:SIP domain-containing protein [Psychrobacter sp. I-STPA10]
MDILARINQVKKIGLDIGSRVFFTSFDGQQRTPLTGEDAEEKVDTLEYIHSYCRRDLDNILHAFTDVHSHKQALPIVAEIYQQGLLIQYIPADVVLDDAIFKVNSPSTEQLISQEDNEAGNDDSVPVESIKQHPTSQTVFVPFRIQDASIDERFYYLYYEALIRLGKMEEVLPDKVTRHYFEVTNTQFVTPNMLRLYLKSDVVLADDDAGFAYRFILTTLNKKGEEQDNKVSFDMRQLPMQLWQQLEPKVKQLPFGTQFINTAKKQGSILFFEVLKRLPEAQREKLESTATGADEGRYYTLRQLKANTDTYLGEVDIYIHEGSPGSEWAKSLKAGDIIYADNDYTETIKNMTIGQPLLICDETSMPSVAAVLERWHIDIIPIVISITNDEADFSYFDEMQLPEVLQDKLDIIHINASQTDNLAQAVIEQIKAQDKQIDCAWGAIGKADFKPIKAYLREAHGLKGKINRIRAYWV